MLVSEELVADVLSVIFAFAARCIAIFREEILLFVDKGVESFQGVTGIIFELHVKEFEFLAQNVLDCRWNSVSTSKDVSRLLTGHILIKFAVLVKKETWHITILEVLNALSRLNLHELSSWMFQGQLCKYFLQHSAFNNATEK